MDERIRKFIPLFCPDRLAIVAVAIYVIVYHVGMPTRDLSGAPANFWLGLWQGLIVFLSFIASWFDNNIVLYQSTIMDFGITSDTLLAFRPWGWRRRQRKSF